jgi:hypothetical protein
VLLVGQYSLHPIRVFTFAWPLFVAIFANRVEAQAELDIQLISCAFLFQTESFYGAPPLKFVFSESQVF